MFQRVWPRRSSWRWAVWWRCFVDVEVSLWWGHSRHKGSRRTQRSGQFLKQQRDRNVIQRFNKKIWIVTILVMFLYIGVTESSDLEDRPKPRDLPPADLLSPSAAQPLALLSCAAADRSESWTPPPTGRQKHRQSVEKEHIFQTWC